MVYISARNKYAVLNICKILKVFMKKLALLGATVSAFALTSCGGSSNSVPSDTVIPGSPQTFYAAPTYVQGTDELAAFNAINSFRSSVGLGYWNQNVYLDQSAASHMQYSVANTAQLSNPFQNDIEVQYYNGTATVGWSGITPSARAIAKGYYILENTVSAVNVPTAVVGELYSTGTGAGVVNDMVNTIYHRGALMAQSTRQVGLARDTTGVATAGTHWWINHGRLDGGQSVASNYLGLYPVDQQTGIPLSMTPEYPSVYSNQTNFNFATQTSSPVSVTTSTEVNLTETSFTVTAAGSGTPLPGKVWTMNNDPNLNTADYSAATLNFTTPPTPVPTIPANEVFWVGSAPFQPNTTYTVKFTGSTYLIPYALTNSITASWSFTTGSN